MLDDTQKKIDAGFQAAKRDAQKSHDMLDNTQKKMEAGFQQLLQKVESPIQNVKKSPLAGT